MYKSCSRCGRIHDEKFKCSAGVKYERQTTEERRLRNLQAWHDKSEATRRAANYICEVCADKGRYTYDGISVHHITPIHDAPELLLEDENLVVVCDLHHKQAEAGLIDKGYLREIAKRRVQRLDADSPPV